MPTDYERNEAIRIANEIVRNIKPRTRRIAVTQEDKEAFGILMGYYTNAMEATDVQLPEDEQEMISRLSSKIYGRR